MGNGEWGMGKGEWGRGNGARQKIPLPEEPRRKPGRLEGWLRSLLSPHPDRLPFPNTASPSPRGTPPAARLLKEGRGARDANHPIYILCGTLRVPRIAEAAPLRGAIRLLRRLVEEPLPAAPASGAWCAVRVEPGPEGRRRRPASVTPQDGRRAPRRVRLRNGELNASPDPARA